jgi:hypothetical protein
VVYCRCHGATTEDASQIRGHRGRLVADSTDASGFAGTSGQLEGKAEEISNARQEEEALEVE